MLSVSLVMNKKLIRASTDLNSSEPPELSLVSTRPFNAGKFQHLNMTNGQKGRFFFFFKVVFYVSLTHTDERIRTTHGKK